MPVFRDFLKRKDNHDKMLISAAFLLSLLKVCTCVNNYHNKFNALFDKKLLTSV